MHLLQRNLIFQLPHSTPRKSGLVLKLRESTHPVQLRSLTSEPTQISEESSVGVEKIDSFAEGAYITVVFDRILIARLSL